MTDVVAAADDVVVADAEAVETVVKCHPNYYYYLPPGLVLLRKIPMEQLSQVSISF